MKLSDFKVLTFDWYGRMINRISGIFNAHGPLRNESAANKTSDQVLENFAQHESEQEEAPAMVYSQLLTILYR